MSSLPLCAARTTTPLPTPSMYILGSTEPPLLPQSPRFQEIIVTNLSTLHTNINIFAFKVVPFEVYTTCPELSHYRKHLWNSIFAKLYTIACHSTLILVILISGHRKIHEELGRARKQWGTTTIHSLFKIC